MRGPSTMPGRMALTRMLRRTEFLGEALGEADDAEFGRRIGRAERVAVAARGRRHVDDGAAACGLQHRHGETGAEELPGEADVDAAPPVGRGDLVDAAGRPGDAGIVDQRVEPAELPSRRRRTCASTSASAETSALHRVQAAGLRFAWRDGVVRDIADATRAPVRVSVLGDGKADAGGAGGDQHALARYAPYEISADVGAVLLMICSPQVRRSRRAITAPRTTRPKRMARVA